jgi:hypothetical protein
VSSIYADSTRDSCILTTVKGIAYQLTENDPLIDTNQCTRDASLMKTLGANTIRVYHVDPTADHSGCMAAFANAGIYLFLDLDTFTTQIDAVSGGHNYCVHAYTNRSIENWRLSLDYGTILCFLSSNGFFRQV